MTGADLSTTAASVTSSVRSCLPVQVPVETGGSVGTVALAVTAAVGITVGALVAFIVGWLVFRQCIGKVCCVFLCISLKLDEYFLNETEWSEHIYIFPFVWRAKWKPLPSVITRGDWSWVGDRFLCVLMPRLMPTKGGTLGTSKLPLSVRLIDSWGSLMLVPRVSREAFSSTVKEQAHA